ncbi:MAG TPA: CoA-transferase [Candidatus Saccharimonadales bacterium]|jgi:glutaconate CoA-transferase subunit A|nr:CoA-transferase [Candidatus Saccharimonadales bacterium]
MSKITTMRSAIAEHVPDGSSVALGLQMEQMIPFAAGHELVRQKRRDLRLIGPISDILFDQIIGSGCVRDVVAAWVGNVMMGSAYNFRRAAEHENPGTPGEPLKVFNMTNFSLALALQAGAMGVPFLPARTAMGSDVPKNNHFFYQIVSPFEPKETLLAVRALQPDVAIVQVQRADKNGNAHCWGNFGVMLEAVRAAKKVIVCAEEIVAEEVIASDPNRTVIPGFLVSAVVECPMGGHPSPVQGYYKRDDAFFQQYHEETRTPEAFAAWAGRWISGAANRAAYVQQLGNGRVHDLGVKTHAYAAAADFGY